MIEIITKINSAVNNFVWGPVMLLLLVGTGVYLTARTGCIQAAKFGYIMRNTVGSLFRRREKRDKDAKNLTPFQAVTTALAGTVGTGNIAGVTGAIFAGGPGAVFWMWFAAFFGMFTKFAEIVLALKYRQVDENGVHYGGPMYYIEKGLGMKWLAVLFSLVAGFACFGIGNISQSSEIAGAMEGLFGMSGLTTGVLLAVVVGIVVLGGVQRIGRVTSYMVPFMAIFYIVAGLAIIVLRISDVPAALASIFTQAFSLEPREIGGGVTGYTIMVSMQQGVARGVFSNEAGLGSAPMAHAASDTQEPVEQGMWGVFEVFVDTFIVCTITALSVLITGEWTSGATNATLALNVFQNNLGFFGTVFMTATMVIFSVTTSGGWYVYYEATLRHLAMNHPTVKKWLLRMFKYFYALPPFLLTLYLIHVGDLSIWTLVDITSGIPTFINVFVVLILSGTYFRLLKDYKARYMNIGTLEDKDMPLFYEDKKKLEKAE